MPFDFDFFSHEFDADPFPIYRRLRDDYPCYWHEQTGIWVLSRHADIYEAVTNHRVFSSEKGNLMEELPGRAGSTLGTTDPPHHDRLRGLIQHAFSRRKVDVLSEQIRSICNAAIDRIDGAKEFDFIADYSSRVSVRSVFAFLGLPPGNEEEVRHHALQVVQYDRATGRRSKAHLESFEWIRAFAGKTIDERRLVQGDDVISQFSVAELDGDRLDEREVLLTISTLLLAGIESLGGFLSVFGYNLARFADVRAAVVSDPGRLPDAIEESLRYNSSAQRFYRRLKKDVPLHGQVMRAGDTVGLFYGAGNRDERRFPDPDRFDLDRKPRAHLGLGAGVHFCIGAMLARLVVRIAIEQFHLRMSAYTLAEEPPVWLPSLNFRAPAAVRLAVG